MNRDSAFVVRTSGSEDVIEWSTSAIPATFEGDSAYFLWACGFGNNLGKEWFDLFIDGESTIPFLTKDESYWSIVGKKGIQLSFTSVYQNSNKANFGYMVLTVPKSILSEKRSLNVSIKGKSSEKEIWYRLFAYKDALEVCFRKRA